MINGASITTNDGLPVRGCQNTRPHFSYCSTELTQAPSAFHTPSCGAAYGIYLLAWPMHGAWPQRGLKCRCLPHHRQPQRQPLPHAKPTQDTQRTWPSPKANFTCSGIYPFGIVFGRLQLSVAFPRAYSLLEWSSNACDLGLFSLMALARLHPYYSGVAHHLSQRTLARG